MFYSLEILSIRNSQQYPGISTVWLASTTDALSSIANKRLTKRDYLHVNVPNTCRFICMSPHPLSLRLQSNLLVGISRVYGHQMHIQYIEASALQSKIRFGENKEQLETKKKRVHKDKEMLEAAAEEQQVIQQTLVPPEVARRSISSMTGGAIQGTPILVTPTILDNRDLAFAFSNQSLAHDDVVPSFQENDLLNMLPMPLVLSTDQASTDYNDFDMFNDLFADQPVLPLSPKPSSSEQDQEVKHRSKRPIRALLFDKDDRIVLSRTEMFDLSQAVHPDEWEYGVKKFRSNDPGQFLKQGCLTLYDELKIDEHRDEAMFSVTRGDYFNYEGNESGFDGIQEYDDHARRSIEMMRALPSTSSIRGTPSSNTIIWPSSHHSSIGFGQSTPPVCDLLMDNNMTLLPDTLSKPRRITSSISRTSFSDLVTTRLSIIQKTITAEDVAKRGMTRATAARSFYALLVAATKSQVRVVQEHPYGPIEIERLC